MSCCVPWLTPTSAGRRQGFKLCSLSVCWPMSEHTRSHPYCWKFQSLVVSTVQLQGFWFQEPFRLSSKLVSVTSHSHFIFRSRDRVEVIALLCLMNYLYGLGPIDIDMFRWVKILVSFPCRNWHTWADWFSVLWQISHELCGHNKWGDNHIFIFLLLVTDTQWSGFQIWKLETNSQPPASISIEVAEALG